MRRNLFIKIWRFVFVGLVVSCLTIFQAFGFPPGFESYLDRPDILHVQPIPYNEDSIWTQRIRPAHFTFIAQLLEMHPDRQLYFLARDSEHLFDVARLVTQGTADADRVHLLNVSRANMRDPNIKEYLAQNGISEEALINGKKVLFVDTGFAGTIPKVIADNFSPQARESLKTHLIVSSNSSHPSSRSFLFYLNPSVASLHPGNMHGTIVNYEHMPRYTDRSDRYFLQSGRYHPLSPQSSSTDGSVSKKIALKYMQDLNKAWADSTIRQKYRSEKLAFREIYRVVNTDPSSESLQKLRADLEGSFGVRYTEAMLRDAVEIAQRIRGNAAINVTMFGYTAVEVGARLYSKKIQLMDAFPEWKPILEDPQIGIKKVFDLKDWTTLGALLDANVDAEFNKILIDHIFSNPATGPQRALQEVAIEKGNPEILNLIVSTLSSSHAVAMKDLLKIMIETGNQTLLSTIVTEVFSKPHASEMKDLIQIVVEKGDKNVLQMLARFVFSEPHAASMKDLIQMVIERANTAVLVQLARSTFSKPHTADMKDLIQIIIEKGDSSVLGTLVAETFTSPHMMDMKYLIEMIVDKANSNVRKLLIVHVFSKPHAEDMKDLIKRVIDKADSDTLNLFKSFTFSKPFTRNDPEYEIMRRSLEIPSQQQRIQFLNSELAKIGSSLAPTQARTQRNSRPSRDAVSSRSSVESRSAPTGRSSQTTSQTPSTPISAGLTANDRIQIGRKTYQIIDVAGEGRRGRVFRIRDRRGQLFALKVAKNNNPDTLRSIQQESAKAAQWKSLNIPHSEVLVQAESYVLKTWVEGVRGDELINRFLGGETSLASAATQLLQLADRIRSQGAYIGDFRPANMIYSNNQWVILDSGSIQQGLSFEEARAKWQEKFERRWRIPLPEESTAPSGPIMCKSVHSPAA